MEEKENVAPAGAVQGAEARQEAGTAALYGKFKNADALLDAYNSLEAEFTRRSQRLRELEGKLAAAGAEKEDPAAQPVHGGEGGAEAAAVQNSEKAERQRIEAAVARAAEAYFAAKEGGAPRVLAGGGAFALAPARRVRTFREAGELALGLFGKNGN